MAWSVYFDPLIAEWLIAVLAAAGLAAVVVGRGICAPAARSSACWRPPLCCSALLNPVVREEEREKLTDIAVVVTDHSLSQALTKRVETTDRAAKNWRNSFRP